MGTRQLRQRLISKAMPFLQDDEQPELATIAFIGSLQLGKTATIAVATALVSVGTMAMYRVPIKQYVLLTNQRLMLFPQNQLTGRPIARVNAELPRSVLGASAAKVNFLTSTVDLSVEDIWGLRLRFPRPVKADALVIARSLSEVL